MAFDRQVASLVQVADRSAAARMSGVCWRTVETMVRRVVAELLPTDLLDGLIAIAIDETSYKRGHRYLTIVTDLVERRVVWIGEGRSAETERRAVDPNPAIAVARRDGATTPPVRSACGPAAR